MEIGFFLLQYAAPQGIAAFVPPTGISFFVLNSMIMDVIFSLFSLCYIQALGSGSRLII